MSEAALPRKVAHVVAASGAAGVIFEPRRHVVQVAPVATPLTPNVQAPNRGFAARHDHPPNGGRERGVRVCKGARVQAMGKYAHLQARQEAQSQWGNTNRRGWAPRGWHRRGWDRGREWPCVCVATSHPCRRCGPKHRSARSPSPHSPLTKWRTPLGLCGSSCTGSARSETFLWGCTAHPGAAHSCTGSKRM